MLHYALVDIGDQPIPDRGGVQTVQAENPPLCNLSCLCIEPDVVCGDSRIPLFIHQIVRVFTLPECLNKLLRKRPDAELSYSPAGSGGDMPVHRYHMEIILHRLLPDNFHVVPVKDRKSTRLNSSHVAISYAVFCLKKKKQQDTKTSTHVK